MSGKAWCVPPATLHARPCCKAKRAVSSVPAQQIDAVDSSKHMYPKRPVVWAMQMPTCNLRLSPLNQSWGACDLSKPNAPHSSLIQGPAAESPDELCAVNLPQLSDTAIPLAKGYAKGGQ